MTVAETQRPALLDLLRADKEFHAIAIPVACRILVIAHRRRVADLHEDVEVARIPGDLERAFKSLNFATRRDAAGADTFRRTPRPAFQLTVQRNRRRRQTCGDGFCRLRIRHEARFIDLKRRATGQPDIVERGMRLTHLGEKITIGTIRHVEESCIGAFAVQPFEEASCRRLINQREPLDADHKAERCRLFHVIPVGLSAQRLRRQVGIAGACIALLFRSVIELAPELRQLSGPAVDAFDKGLIDTGAVIIDADHIQILPGNAAERLAVRGSRLPPVADQHVMRIIAAEGGCDQFEIGLKEALGVALHIGKRRLRGHRKSAFLKLIKGCCLHAPRRIEG